MAPSARIISDSACDLPQPLIAQHDIGIVPLSIRFGDEEFIDRVELSKDEFWSRMSSSSSLPSTAAPSPGSFAKAFQEAAGAEKIPVICITLSSKISGTYQAAVAGVALLDESYDIRIIDSTLCTVAQGLLCLEAAELAENGKGVDAIEKAVTELRSRIHVYGALDTLENLRKGGRIGAAGAFFGSILSVKPIITFSGGEVRPESRQRTRSRALTHLAGLVTSHAPLSRIAVTHSNASDLEQFLSMLAPVAERDKIIVSDIGPVIGTHGGEGIIAVAFSNQSEFTSNHNLGGIS